MKEFYEGKYYSVYILASQQNGTLYIGMTGDLLARVEQHKQGAHEGFTKKYGVKKLVYYEIHTDPSKAITREKQMKKWKRNWKIELIEKMNPYWRDLFRDLVSGKHFDPLPLGPCFRRDDNLPLTRECKKNDD